MTYLEKYCCNFSKYAMVLLFLMFYHIVNRYDKTTEEARRNISEKLYGKSKRQV